MENEVTEADKVKAAEIANRLYNTDPQPTFDREVYVNRVSKIIAAALATERATGASAERERCVSAIEAEGERFTHGLAALGIGAVVARSALNGAIERIREGVQP